MVAALIALGSNIGKRQAALRAALARLATLPATRITAVANFHETDPVAMPPGSARFINGAAALETSLSPSDLLDHLLRIERELGRNRLAAEGPLPRIIDLDLLLYGDQIIDTPALSIPHPRMHARRFVLEPLAEIAPDAVHPRLGQTVRQLLAALQPEPAR